MGAKMFLVDAFCAGPFTGNPAAVCLLDAHADERWMQAVASEMNQAETAYLWPRSDGDFDLRWFTPLVEVDLCGHATLASAHILLETCRATREKPIRFHTRSGILGARPYRGKIELDFPSEPVTECEPPKGLLGGLGVEATFVGKSRLVYLVEVPTEGALRNATPDFKSLALIPAVGVILTCRSNDPRIQFVSRFFAPQSGVDEDAATGAAHCSLGPYWLSKLHKNPMLGYQASRRGGHFHVEVRGERVLLRGAARTILSGALTIP
jgi:predicted PhzF superfamily epimerase YddE/YHI9